MKSLIRSASSLTLPLAAVVVLVAILCSGAMPAGADETRGIAKLQLSSYYDGQPIEVSPAAPSYSLPIQLKDVGNGEFVATRLHLDDNAREAIERNGFVVVNATTPWGKMYDDVVDPYLDLEDDGIPIFVTSDSLLHIYHIHFDEILKCVEENEFFASLVVMSNALLGESLAQYESFSDDLKEAARRNVAFFTVAMKLLGEEVSVPDYVTEEVNDELALIDAHEGFSPSPIFIYMEDYSQYVPRGHYTRSEVLQKFFKAMMWYGRMSFLLKGSEIWGPMGEALISVWDARIQTIQASLITLALDSLETEGKSIAGIWNRIYAVTAFFVGLADDLTPYEYKESIMKVFGWPMDVEDFNDEEKMFDLKVELALLRSPQIYGGTGHIFVLPPITPEKLDEVLEKTKGMRLMGQRFVPDSYMFQNLVFPVVAGYLGSGHPFTMEVTPAGPMRCFPRGLDVMAVLGSDDALAILERDGDTDYVDYDKALNELVALFATFNEDDWNRNLYWSWLYTLKSLLDSYGQGYPGFMQGRAWQDKQLNTALASWTELRHDTILYAKQSYTPPSSIPPEPDPGCVEPVPEFYNRLRALTRMTRTGLSDMNVLDATQEERLRGLEEILGRLTDISIAEVEGRELSMEDCNYIRHFGGVLKPLVQGLSDEKARGTTLIADVHTDLNTYQVLEEAVGYVKYIVAAYKIPQGKIVLGAGPVFSYYEFKWPMSDRLTDEKWTEMLENGEQPPPPDWVRSFMHPVTFSPATDDDIDRDLLSDSWERSIWGGIEAVNDADGDDDGDGVSNEDECRAGTNANDRESFLDFLDIVPTQSGPRLRWRSIHGKRYRISCSSDLRTWYLLGTPISAEAEDTDLVDADASSLKERFYRVNVIP
ncbi:DUF3160 domain-containing protein [bacterium]|nr:DUF3160 domain-containing protein [bacterium]